jgi:NADH-quinone oxidoreductase subunit L
LALGVGAWSAAVFHFMTHAFFKALLFLGAGAVIMGLHEEHCMFKMGGLRKQLPLTFWVFLIGAASLSALPLVTAGFYSKDLILWEAWSSQAGSPWLWAAGLVGALLTSVYAFRMVFLTFFGQAQQQVSRKPGLSIQVPLITLAVLSIVSGFIELPDILGNRPLLSDFLHTVLPATASIRGGTNTELTLEIVAGISSLAGIFLAYLFFLRSPQSTANLVRTSIGTALHHFWFVGWGFDWLYNTFVVRPFIWLAHIDKNDFIDLFYQGIAWVSQALYHALSRTVTGQVRWYAIGIAIGAVITIAISVLL